MQSKMDSLMEAVTNTAVGFAISLVVQFAIINPLVGLHASSRQSIVMVGIFTFTSIVRQYVLRRIFNERSMWTVIKRKLHAQ